MISSTHQRHTANLPILLAVTLICVISAGCALQNAFTGADREPIHHLSFHAFATGNMVGNMTRVVSDADGMKKFRIRRFPILSSRQITRAAVVEEGTEPGGSVLRLWLDRHGQFCWMQVCAQMPGDRVAVLLDGFFVCAARLPRSAANPQVIELRGPWSVEEAQAIAKHVSENYRKLNSAF